MKIKVELDESVTEEVPGYVDYELSMLKILEDDTYFERKIKEIRKKLQIPKNGYPSTEETFNKIENRNFEDKALKETSILRHKYHLPSEWTVFLYHYVVLNKVILTKVNEIEIFEEKALLKKLSEGRERYVEEDSSILIKINADLNLNSLIKQIKIGYPQIKEFFEKKKFYGPIKKVSVKNLDRYKKIYDLRIRKNKKIKDIAESLVKNDNFRADSDVRAMLIQYKKLIKNLRKEK